MRDSLERLRAANPVAGCPPPSIEAVWRQVELDDGSIKDRGLETDQPPVASGTRTWRSRGVQRIADVLLPACAIGVVVLITALAVLLGHTARTHRSAAPSTSQPTGPLRMIGLGPSPSVDRALTAELGILRQPQTPAARAFNTAPKLGLRLAQSVPFIPSLTRAIKLPHHVTLYLYMAQRAEYRTLSGGREHLAPGGLGVMLRAPFQGFGECCVQPQELKRPVGPQATPYTMSQKPDWLYVELVPDGVATVRWTFPAATIRRLLPHARRTVTVHVRDNVAAIALPHAGSGNSGGTQSDAWYRAHGQLIARHTS